MTVKKALSKMSVSFVETCLWLSVALVAIVVIID
jgi:hypothetical protein